MEVRWKGEVADDELSRLHSASFGLPFRMTNWNELLSRHSLGWVTARIDARLVGFVNVPWDGLVHAWIQDVIVDPDRQRGGIGTAVVAAAAHGARAAGCEWLHVDFDDEHRPFYLDACGFVPTAAGLIDLTVESD
ncbi:MAG: GNAT family N-acetyltransferase [Actinomycetota bacterium]